MKKNSANLNLFNSIVMFLVICLTFIHTDAQERRRKGPGVPGGGGAGINDQVFEGKIFDPTESIAFKTHLKEFFDRLDLYTQENFTRTIDKDRYKPYPQFRTKTWYLIESEIKKIDPISLGTSDLNVEPLTYAIQNFQEVWLDATTFRKMDSKNQALLILHEFVVSAYMARYQKQEVLNENLFRVGLVRPEFQSHFLELGRKKDLTTPPLEYSGLTSDDYVSIRRMVSWIWENKNTVGGPEFRKKMIQLNFDPRAQRLNNKPIDSNRASDRAINIPYDRLIEEITASIVTNKLNPNCFNEKNQLIEDCRIDLIDLKTLKIKHGNLNHPIDILSFERTEPLKNESGIIEVELGRLTRSELNFKEKTYYGIAYFSYFTANTGEIIIEDLQQLVLTEFVVANKVGQFCTLFPVKGNHGLFAQYQFVKTHQSKAISNEIDDLKMKTELSISKSKKIEACQSQHFLKKTPNVSIRGRKRCRHLATLPHGRPCNTIAAIGLNC